MVGDALLYEEEERRKFHGFVRGKEILDPTFAVGPYGQERGRVRASSPRDLSLHVRRKKEEIARNTKPLMSR